MDNIDVDPSSTTASSSFHGTGISLFQHPSVPAEGIDCERIILGGVSGMKTVGRLPNYYTDVPPVTASKKGSAIPCTGLSSLEAKLEHNELEWLECVREVIEMEEENDDYKDISWSAFHAQRQSTQQYPSTSSALLPLFHESAATVGCNAMDVVNQAIKHLNPGQIPVIAFDQPLFAIAKEIQWRWPTSSFAGHGKRLAWAVWSSFPELTAALLRISQMPTEIDAVSFETIERFIILLYDRTSTSTSVDDARKHLFTKKGRSLEAKPPTRASHMDENQNGRPSGSYFACPRS